MFSKNLAFSDYNSFSSYLCFKFTFKEIPLWKFLFNKVFLKVSSDAPLVLIVSGVRISKVSNQISCFVDPICSFSTLLKSKIKCYSFIHSFKEKCYAPFVRHSCVFHS